MKVSISKDQSQELRQVLTRMKVARDTIEILLSSKYAASVYKAYLYKKKILTDDKWTIHFGANWARPPASETNATLMPDTPGAAQSQTDHDSDSDTDDITINLDTDNTTDADLDDRPNTEHNTPHAAQTTSQPSARPEPPPLTPEQAAREIASKQPVGEDLASRTLQTIVSFIRKPKTEEPPKPRMRKIAIELDEDILVKLKKLSDAENIPISALIRLAVRKYVS